jgi:hypothetical protein
MRIQIGTGLQNELKSHIYFLCFLVLGFGEDPVGVRSFYSPGSSRTFITSPATSEAPQSPSATDARSLNPNDRSSLDS